MPLFQGFCPVAGTICPSLAAAVVGPSRAPQGMKKGRRPRRRPRLKLSDKAGPDQCPVPGENALFPAQIAGFLAVSRAVPVYPVFLNYVVPVHSAFLRIMCPRPWRNYGRSSAQPDPYRLIGEKSLPSKWKAGFCRAFSYLSLFQSAFMNTHSARLYLPFILPGSGAQLRTSHSRGPAHRRYPRSSYSRPSAYRAFRDHPLRSPADFQS